MPDRNNTNGIRRLENSITAVREIISKSYMEQFTENDCQVLRVNDRDRVQTGIRLLKIDQIALSDELMESRLTSIYQTLKQLVNSCFMVIQGTGEEVSVYLGFQADAAGKQATAGRKPQGVSKTEMTTHDRRGAQRFSKGRDERLGFTFCGRIREAGYKFGRWLGVDHYQIMVDSRQDVAGARKEAKKPNGS